MLMNTKPVKQKFFAGKQVGGANYVHVSALDALDARAKKLVSDAAKVAALAVGRDFNVIKYTSDYSKISLLNYPHFSEDPFPSLHESWVIEPKAQRVEKRSYAASLNPPILHRKELFILPQHPDFEKFKTLTQQAESFGLFNDTTKIGFKNYWEALIRAQGLKLQGHTLLSVEVPELKSQNEPIFEVSRQLTALTRYGYSAPVQALAKFGYLDRSFTIFDYGCGKGDDLRGLSENGISAEGWDPFFAPDKTKVKSDIVNLGFVLNVIEDVGERVEALNLAYALAEKFLVVAVMLNSQEKMTGTPYKDGVLTQRKTFQKYYSQAEFRVFLQQSLGEEPVAIAPGIFFVFKDKDEEQRLLLRRSRSASNVLRAASIAERVPRISRIEIQAARLKEAETDLEPLWVQWLNLGRAPHKSESLLDPAVVLKYGSYPKVVRILESLKDETVIESIATQKKNDLMVYFALGLFSKRKKYKHLENSLQHDVKFFFGDYLAAQEQSRQLLFKIADSGAIAQACKEASELGLGYLIPGESLHLHTSLVERLPPLLRAYIGCGTAVYGDVTSADLIKIHINSGKLTLMKFDNFESPLPKMVERVKINFRTQVLDRFEYGEQYAPPYLFLKSRFMNEELPQYAEQLKFDEQLNSLHAFDLVGYGPKPKDFEDLLKHMQIKITGFEIAKVANG